jgi:aspartate aminotransferase
MGSREMADRLLSEAGVACLNGASFGTRGEGFIRFSYANSFENMAEAARRIREFIARQ